MNPRAYRAVCELAEVAAGRNSARGAAAAIGERSAQTAKAAQAHGVAGGRPGGGPPQAGASGRPSGPGVAVLEQMGQAPAVQERGQMQNGSAGGPDRALVARRVETSPGGASECRSGDEHECRRSVAHGCNDDRRERPNEAGRQRRRSAQGLRARAVKRSTRCAACRSTCPRATTSRSWDPVRFRQEHAAQCARLPRSAVGWPVFAERCGCGAR